MSTARSEDIQISGFVTKLELNDGLTASRRRWAIVISHCLYLHKNQNDRQFTDCIILPGCRISMTHNSVTTKPLIRITEDNGDFIQITPENFDAFEYWFDTLSRSSSLNNTSDVQPISLQDEPEFHSRMTNPGRSPRDSYDSQRNYGYAPELQQDYGQSFVDPRGNSLDRVSYAPSQHSQRDSYYNQKPGTNGDQWLAPSIYTDRYQASPVQDNYRHSTYSIDQGSDHAAGHNTRTGLEPIHFEKNRERKVVLPNRYGNMAYSHGGPHNYSTNQSMSHDQPPRKQSVIETVPEDPDMNESMILATKPIDEIRRKYPVSGLAKRMSIAASDLLGKSHDELVLLLIQLNREKANLERWNDYLTRVIGQTYAEIRRSNDQRKIQSLEQQVRQDEEELKEIRHQIDLSQPLITFIDNIVKMGALYGGDDLMFATEYRKHLVNPNDYRPAKANLSFMREVQERQIAKDLAHRLNVSSVNAIEGGNYESFETQSVADSLWPSVQDNESPEIRITRQQLEAELSDLENIYRDLLGQKTNLSSYMDTINKSGLKPHDPEKSKQKEKKDDEENSDLSIKFPRRSTRKNKRSDFYTSMKRTSRDKEQISPPRRQWSMYASRRMRPQILDALNIEPVRTTQENQMWDPNDRRPSVEPGSSQYRPTTPPHIQRDSIGQNYASLDWSQPRNRAPDHQQPHLRQPSNDIQYSSLVDPPVEYQERVNYYVPTLNLRDSASMRSGISSQVSNRPDLSNTHPHQSYTYDDQRYEPQISPQDYRGAYTLPPSHHGRAQSPNQYPHYGKSMTMPLDGLSMGMRSETDLRYVELDSRRNNNPPETSSFRMRNPDVHSAHDLRIGNNEGGFTMSQVKAGLSRNSSGNHLNAEGKKSHHSSVQEQLNDILGLDTDDKSMEDTYAPKSPGVISTGSGRRGPLIKLNKNHFKADRGATGTYNENKALENLGSYLENFRGLEPGSVKLKSRFPGDPGVSVEHHHHHSSQQLHDPYEETHLNHQHEDDKHRIYENLAAPPVEAYYPTQIDDGPVRAVYMSGRHYASSRDDDSLERQQHFPGARKEPDDSFNIDNVLSTPRQINIGERYRPELDYDDRQLTPEERKRQRERLQDMRKMIVDQS